MAIPAALSLFFLALIGYQGYVSWRVWVDEGATAGQRYAQLAMIWCLPLAGAVLVHWVLHGQSRASDPASRKYAEPETEPDQAPHIFYD